MAKNIENIRNLIEIRSKFTELTSLKDECLLVFSPSSRVTMEFIEEKVNNEWNRLYQLVPIHAKYDIKMTFRRLKNGEINRKEFKALMSDAIESVEKEYSALVEELKKAEAKVNEDYNSFFNTTSHRNSHFKYIYFVLSQPETKALLLNYLESDI